MRCRVTSTAAAPVAPILLNMADSMAMSGTSHMPISSMETVSKSANGRHVPARKPADAENPTVESIRNPSSANIRGVSGCDHRR
ncbi:MAG: hypothetical protein COV99_08870 [Bacteroidetes bacterium CG12_big_fil_rev_8_21_14_0_65_60_17]|nr:MAG: hypothetical protein COV99_08870 [Bacteroidetes bacterium CG12_big_fil_rev_8_21_14_0_65_60_17]